MAASSMFSGIVHNNGLDNGPLIHLPLEELAVKAFVIDISARVTLKQTFSNPGEHPTSQCVYYLPVPASGAICAFEMQTEDGRRIEGRCLEKEQATKEHQDALHRGQFTGLLHSVTDDVFTISIGSIPARQTVTTTVVYVMTLMNADDVDSIRLQVPVYVGERYGTPLPELDGASSVQDRTRIRITIDIQMTGRIENISSPSHSSIKEHRYNHSSRESTRRSTIRYRSSTFFTTDFVLLIRAKGLEDSRCFAELKGDPFAGRGHNATLALQFALLPRMRLPPVPSQEYLFVIDRSGSMSGAPMEKAKETMCLLLKMLPAEGTTFNIFSFGNHCDSIWPSSVSYDQSNLDRSICEVNGMTANYGGTEIRAALEYALQSRSRFTPTAIFVLTDGAANDIHGTTTAVQTSVSKAPLHAPIRVFTLGIGDHVSTAMCEQIAEAGNGQCLLAVTAESILSRCYRLFSAGRSQILENVSIDWGVTPEYLSSSSSSVEFHSLSSSSDLVPLRAPPTIQQYPSVIGNISAGNRFPLFAIIRLRNIAVPKKITLKGNVVGSQDIVEITVPVKGVQLQGADEGALPLHTLAASYLIREQTNGQGLPHTAMVEADDGQIRKATIVRLGIEYQLASKYTSFVAVDDGRQNHRSSRHDFGSWRETDTDTPRTSIARPWSWFSVGAIRESIRSLWTSDPEPMATMPGAWTDKPPVNDGGDESGDDEGYETERTFSTLSSLVSSASESQWSDWSTEEVTEEDRILQERQEPLFQIVDRPAASNSNVLPVPPPLPQEIIAVVRMQLYDGSFDLNDGLVNSIGMTAGSVRQMRNDIPGVSDQVLATAIAVAYLEKGMQGQKELLDDLLDKARQYLSRNGADTVVRRIAIFLP